MKHNYLCWQTTYQNLFLKETMTRKNSPKKTSSLKLSVCFYVGKKYKLCTCTCKPVQNGKNISFCILVSDKNTHDLATYIHLSIWLFKAHKVVQSTQSINSGSLQKDVSFTQKYLWQYKNSNQRSFSSRYNS